ncbi:hypothetical protein KEM52_000833 [Ascosphaera acerosa]|nr:hypothetical protein KEM52_000833 [Ascosphaera acerosa]
MSLLSPARLGLRPVRLRLDGRGGRGAFAGRNIKMEYGGRRSNTQSGVNSPATSDDESAGKFSIEQINVDSDDDEDGDGKIKGKQPERATARRGMRPERLERTEHVERHVGVNTESAASKSAQMKIEAAKRAAEEQTDEPLFFSDDDDGDRAAGYASDQAEITGVRPAAGRPDDAETTGPRIKAEPGTEEMALDDVPLAGTEAQPARSTRSRKHKSKDPKSMLQTEEERQEYDRYAQEVSELKRALGTLTTEDVDEELAKKGVAATDEEKKRAIAREEAEAIKAERQQRLFLVQFPPMTPNLADPRQLAADSAAAAAAAAAAGQDSATGTAPPTKTDADAPSMISATRSRLPPGRAGKLEIHASGRATITWGGVRMELNKGSDVSFLQDAILMEEHKPLSGTATPSIVAGNADRDGPPEKSVWAMSQVSGKFVVTPDWESML